MEKWLGQQSELLMSMAVIESGVYLNLVGGSEMCSKTAALGLGAGA